MHGLPSTKPNLDIAIAKRLCSNIDQTEFLSNLSPKWHQPKEKNQPLGSNLTTWDPFHSITGKNSSWLESADTPTSEFVFLALKALASITL